MIIKQINSIVWCAIFMTFVPVALEAQQADLTPVTEFKTRLLQFDFPSVHIGIAEYEEGPTGTTVFYFPGGAFAAVDVRGGAPGTILTAAVQNGFALSDRKWVDAICFAGGSAYGLEAASGVMLGLLMKRNYSTVWYDIAGVAGAIIFDFNRRENAIYPDRDLGLAAFKAAEPNRFYLGARGAGRSAGTGWYFGPSYAEASGQGAAFREVGTTKIAVFTVVNSNGTIIDRSGQVIRGNRDPNSGMRTLVSDDLRLGRRKSEWEAFLESKKGGPTRNTTISLVVTNQTLEYSKLRRLAIYVHTSMARAIRPFHAPSDGDTLFAVTTAEIENPDLSFEDLATHAADIAWDAVLSSVPEN